ncbi:MAG: lactate racemase domain-containing protein [Isosphaeraceae bacterium]
MQVRVTFQDEHTDFDVPEDRLVGVWSGPADLDPGAVRGQAADAFENPLGFPPLREAVVPGDHVVLAVGADVPEPAPILAALVEILEARGVSREDVTVLSGPGSGRIEAAAPTGTRFVRHDPEDRSQLAYLASTSEGRRIYLNRWLTDADFVVPVGRLGYDGFLGYRGPWSVIFPDLSDTPTRLAFRAVRDEVQPDREHPAKSLGEVEEVSWLLGCQFQVGAIAGASGTNSVVAGTGKAVYEEGSRRLDAGWSHSADERAELVIAGVGSQGKTAGIAEVARGLSLARRLVRRGGKIALLSRANGDVGPALRRLAQGGNPRQGMAALKGREADEDYPVARQIADAVAWADVYLLSHLDDELVDSLSIVPLERPEEARRLAATSHSCLLVSGAEHVRGTVADEDR